MRIIITLQAKDLRLPMACNAQLQGLIYTMLGEDREYAAFLHDGGYRREKKVFKLFTFSGIQGPYSVQDGELVFRNGGVLEVRSPVPKFAERLAAACRPGTMYTLNGQIVTVTGCSRRETPRLQSGVTVYTVTPVTVHTMDSTRHTRYWQPDEKEFYTRIASNGKRKWESLYGERPTRFALSQVQEFPPRRIVTRFKDTRINAWHGHFVLRGDQETLSFLYSTGLGDRNSQGFGMFEVLA